LRKWAEFSSRAFLPSDLRRNSDGRNALLENSAHFLKSFQNGEGVVFFQKYQ